MQRTANTADAGKGDQHHDYDGDVEKTNVYHRQQGDHSSPPHDDEGSRRSRQSSFLGNTPSDDERKGVPAVPESVAVMDADNRSQCSQKSELGYQSAGALSDAPPTAAGGLHHEVNFDNRSHASEGALSDIGPPSSSTAVPAPPVAITRARSAQHQIGNVKYMLNRESMQQVAQSITEARRTRNSSTAAGSVASYPASEAAKSDIATVCSSSIIEDIDMSSIMSGDAPTIGSSSAALPSPSVTSHPIVIMGGNFRRSTSAGGTIGPRAVEFAPLSAPKDAGETLVVPNHKNMGPPLSRGLLTALFQASSAPAGGSRAGSVKSFGSNAGASQGSDVVDHNVDTDDGGGSLTDGHSVLSHDRSLEEEAPHQRPALTASAAESFAAVNPLFLQDDNNTNGRTSPGGTIYKGKGVRRYQGRYMNLPLKRFDEENGGGGKVSAIDETTMAADQEEKEQQHRRSGYRRAKFTREDGGERAKRRRSRSRDRSASPLRRGGGGRRDEKQHSPTSRGGRRRGSRSDGDTTAWRDHQPYRKGSNMSHGRLQHK